MTEPEIIEIRDTEIDVQAIMAEIREKIAQKKKEGIFSPEVEKGLRLPLPDLPNTIAEEDVLTSLSQKVCLDIDLPIRSHRRPPLGPMIVAGKKLLRSILRWYFEQIGLQVESFQRGIVEALHEERNRVQNLNSQTEVISKRLDAFEKKVRQLEIDAEAKHRWIKDLEGRAAAWAEKKGLLAVEGTEIDYLEFNRRYGGSEDRLRERYKQFITYFEGCQDVVDLGCGQGAFLQALKDRKIPAIGVDLDRRMIQHCRERGLEVIQSEVLNYLRGQRAQSLGGIFAAHLVEHLSSPQLFDLVKHCHEALRPGAPIVLISPNGCSIFVLSQAFYRDPTHIRPVHPDTLAFLLESQGFLEVAIHFYEEVPLELRLPYLEERGEGAAIQAVNRHIAELNHFLFGFQDYAVVAKK